MRRSAGARGAGSGPGTTAASGCGSGVRLTLLVRFGGRWEKSRDADESYLDEPIWNRIWARAVAESGIPLKPTAYQVRHTHASWLIDAGESPKAVMHRLGQADLRTTARYVHVLDETGESAAKRFKGLLPPL
jgi:integrase